MKRSIELDAKQSRALVETLASPPAPNAKLRELMASTPPWSSTLPSDPHARALVVLGSAEAAEEWMQRPAMGLNGRRPVDMLDDPTDREILLDFLCAIEHSVHW